MKALYPDAAILVHPESPESVVALADAVGSTSQLIKAAQTLPNKTFIVATDRGIFYKMQQLCPDKDFIEAPTAGNGAACRSCAHCPWMAMNTLERTLACLREGSGGNLRRPGVDPAGGPSAQAHARLHPGRAPAPGRERLNLARASRCVGRVSAVRLFAQPLFRRASPGVFPRIRRSAEHFLDHLFLLANFLLAGVESRSQLEVAASAALGEIELLDGGLVVAGQRQVLGRAWCTPMALLVRLRTSARRFQTSGSSGRALLRSSRIFSDSCGLLIFSIRSARTCFSG